MTVFLSEFSLAVQPIKIALQNELWLLYIIGSVSLFKTKTDTTCINLGA